MLAKGIDFSVRSLPDSFKNLLQRVQAGDTGGFMYFRLSSMCLIFAVLNTAFTSLTVHRTHASANTSVNAGPEEHFHHLPAGGRRSLHGMVLFGAGPYFLEHIPVLSPPHDFQIIAEVRLRDASGKPVSLDFSTRTTTFKPSTNFSLNDYVTGRLRSLSGAIHDGGFEQGGEVLVGFESVEVEVIAYKLIRQLPSPSNESVFRVSDGVSNFESNLIRPEDSIQRITNTSTQKQLWCVTGPDFFEVCP